MQLDFGSDWQKNGLKIVCFVNLQVFFFVFVAGVSYLQITHTHSSLSVHTNNIETNHSPYSITFQLFLCNIKPQPELAVYFIFSSANACHLEPVSQDVIALPNLCGC